MSKVLVIEDNQDNLRLISYALKRKGYEILASAQGEEGIELALKELPSFIIIDINLPGIDGLEVARRIRDLPPVKEIPLFAITSYAMVGDKEKIMKAGFNGYFEKPIDPINIVDRMQEILGKRRRNENPHR